MYSEPFSLSALTRPSKTTIALNHSGGELETSFFREFYRTLQQSHLVGSSTVTTQSTYSHYFFARWLHHSLVPIHLSSIVSPLCTKQLPMTVTCYRHWHMSSMRLMRMVSTLPALFCMHINRAKPLSQYPRWYQVLLVWEILRSIHVLHFILQGFTVCTNMSNVRGLLSYCHRLSSATSPSCYIFWLYCHFSTEILGFFLQ